MKLSKWIDGKKFKPAHVGVYETKDFSEIWDAFQNATGMVKNGVLVGILRALCIILKCTKDFANHQPFAD